MATMFPDAHKFAGFALYYSPRPTRGQGVNLALSMKRPFTASWGTDKRTVASQVLPLHRWVTSHFPRPALGLGHPYSTWWSIWRVLRYLNGSPETRSSTFLFPAFLSTAVASSDSDSDPELKSKLEPRSQFCLKDNGIEQFYTLTTLSLPNATRTHYMRTNEKRKGRFQEFLSYST